MAVPSTVADLDAIASNNSPAGSEAIGTSLDDYLRAHGAIIKQVSNAKQDTLVSGTSIKTINSTSLLGSGNVVVAAAGAIGSSGLTMNTARLLGRTTASSGAVEEITVSGATLSGTTLTITQTFASSAENAAGTVENKAVDPLGIREAFNATGTAPVYACRAWVNFNGTGTVAIRASGNVSSITDNGTGDYTVNFTTALPDANYAVAGSVQRGSTNDDNRSISIANATSPTASAVRITVVSNAVANDATIVTAAVFR